MTSPMAEAAYRVKKLDIVIFLLAGHIALDLTNPGLVAIDNPIMRGLTTVIAGGLALLLSVVASGKS